MKKRRVVAIGIVTLFLAGCGAAASNPPSSSGSSSSGSTTIQWGHQSKTLGCAGIGNGC